MAVGPNTKIIYSDQELNPKDLGNDIKVTTIPTIAECELNNCIKTILESNQNVIFNTIQYSKEKEIVYFYTDKEISLYYWYYKPLSNAKEVLEEVKRVFRQPKNKDNNCISLYDVSRLLKRTYEEYKNLEKVYISKINEFFNPNTFFVGGIVPKGTNIKIYFLENLYDRDIKELIFYKQDGKLIYENTKNIPKPFLILEEILSELYDDFIKYSEFFYQRQKQLGGSKVINLKFRFIINSEGLDIFDNLDMFNVSWVSGAGVYNYSFDNIIKQNGGFDELFKRIFVEIEDCPKWSRPILYEIRQNQLVEEKRIEEERKNQERKKQKRIEFRNKIFPFLKNK